MSITYKLSYYWLEGNAIEYLAQGTPGRLPVPESFQAA